MASIVLPEGIQLLSGVEANRASVIPDVAEPLVTTDERRLFIGDNATAGGNEISYLCLRTGGTVTGGNVGISRANAALTIAASSGDARINLQGASAATIVLTDNDAAAGVRRFRNVNSEGKWYVDSLQDTGSTIDGSNLVVHHAGAANRGGVVVGRIDNTDDKGLGTLNATADLYERGTKLEDKYLQTANLVVPTDFVSAASGGAFAGGVYTTGATGGSQGANTFNASEYFDDGVNISSIYARISETVPRTGGSFTGNIGVSKASAAASIVSSAGDARINLNGATSALLIFTDGDAAAGEKRFRQIDSNGRLYFDAMQDSGATIDATVMALHHAGNGGGGVVIGSNLDALDRGVGTINTTSDIYESDVKLESKYAMLSGGVFTGSVAVGPPTGDAAFIVTGETGELRLVDKDYGTASDRALSVRASNGTTEFAVSSAAGLYTRTAMTIQHANGAVIVGAPTGGFSTGGTLNAHNLLVQGVNVSTASDERLKNYIAPLALDWRNVDAVAGAANTWIWNAPDTHAQEPQEGFVAQRLEDAGFAKWVITDNPGEPNEAKRIDKAAMPMLAHAFLALSDINRRVASLEAA